MHLHIKSYTQPLEICDGFLRGTQRLEDSFWMWTEMQVNKEDLLMASKAMWNTMESFMHGTSKPPVPEMSCYSAEKIGKSQAVKWCHNRDHKSFIRSFSEDQNSRKMILNSCTWWIFLEITNDDLINTLKFREVYNHCSSTSGNLNGHIFMWIRTWSKVWY